MEPDARRWFARRTSARADWSPVDLRAAKGSTRVSVVLPALDEEATVGAIVATIRRELVDVREPLVDELVVIDSGSTDATAAVAAEAGARVVHRDDAWPGEQSFPGKGEAMWRSQLVTTGDVVVFVDADLRGFEASYVTGLLGPLLTDTGVSFVKGFYQRPLHADPAGDGDRVLDAMGGGRVTELVARPLINLHWPALAGIVQPLAGEYAARRSLLEVLPFPCGYGVELGLLVDTLRVAGLDAIAQVDLGVRHHRHQDLRALGRMSAEIWQTAIDRLDRDGRIVLVQEPLPSLVQFEPGGSGRAHVPTAHDVTLRQRPPVSTLAAYTRERVAGPRP